MSTKSCSPIDIHASEDEVFRSNADEGHLETIKWLYRLSWKIGSPIDFHARDDYAFVYSSANGHFDTCQWLFQLPEQHIYHDMFIIHTQYE